MKKVLYDTCSLLNELQAAFVTPFYISNITLEELEDIKTSSKKDEDVKYRARQLLHLLFDNKDKYEVIIFKQEWLQQMQTVSGLTDNNDSKIIFTALTLMQDTPELIFKTDDLACAAIAESLGLRVETSYEAIKSDNYTGFIELLLDDEQLEEFYENALANNKNIYNLLENEYLIIKNTAGELIDTFKMSDKEYKSLRYPTFKSDMLGTIKPKDVYQQIVMDSLIHNTITVVRGPAGSGKSYLAMGALFQKLEKGQIDKIIIFCNTVATAGSAKLGYYPGSRDEKLLDSQIGNFLSSKLGDKLAVERMIADGQIVLLPMSDVRGYDTTGMRAGIYITEAQNLDIELMRLALQRIGDDSICILDGDDQAQVDLSLYAGTNNGLRRVSEIFRGEKEYGEVTLQKIHRSRIAELAQLM